MALSSLSGSDAANVAAALQTPADKMGNDPLLEMQWAMKAFQHTETYFNLITAVDPTYLKLTRVDDDIYKQFREDFPDLKVDVLNEDVMKSVEGKERWRKLCNQFEGKVQDWNMGSLVRLDCHLDVSDKNTSLVPRIQFLAIEIARNREGLNAGLREKYRPVAPSGER